MRLAGSPRQLSADPPTARRRGLLGQGGPMSFASIAAGTSIGESNAVDTVERDALRSYLSRQFAVLTRCHSVDDIILLRVLADNHQHAALQAKKGSIATARSEMRADR